MEAHGEPPNDLPDPQKRDWLIEEVIQGRMSPEEAEAVADRLGLGELATDPADKFNPMSVPSWSLAMVLAWLIWRQVDKVREYWDAYAAACLQWRSHPVRRAGEVDEWEERYSLEQPDPPSANSIVFNIAADNIAEVPVQAVMTYTKAKEALWNALVSGRSVATAISTATGEPVSIPSPEWAYLDLYGDRDMSDCLRLKGEPFNPRYFEMRFKAADVRRLWPVRKSDKGTQQPRKRVSEARLKKVCEDFRDSCIKSGHIPNESEIREEVADKIGGHVTREAVRKVWRDIRPPEWAKNGPRAIAVKIKFKQ